MSEVTCLTIDAFTDRPFSGNPAAVCLLDEPCDAEWMQSVAAEMNLSETAFVWPLTDGYGLRWFTPRLEVDLCGHATLAAAHALWTEDRVAEDDAIRFETRSGLLTCVKRCSSIELDFPATPAEPATDPAPLAAALGTTPSFFGRSKFDALFVVDDEQALRALAPDFEAIEKLPYRGVIVTSPSDDARFDFVSRFFAPAAGIDEDPVTGSAHCCLGPYWSERLGRSELTAYQASTRGGVVELRVSAERVVLGGRAVTVMRGLLYAEP